MKILVLNRGSSTIKCSLYDNFTGTFTHPTWEDNRLVKKKIAGVQAIGHRIVHGGNHFKKSALIDPLIKDKIASLAKIAPLHNLTELEDIKKMEKLFPNIPQIAVFDTAFHHTLSEAAFTYPGPYKWALDGIRRYGFHGISFQYCTKRASELLHQSQKGLKMVICHLGAGASLCAVKDGKSIDTTMGFTPLEGLMMDTRSGSIDPGILLHLLDKKSPKELSFELYHASGLLGISGIPGGMQATIDDPSPRAKLAIDIYIHRLTSLIGSMIASLNGIDALIFTAGIGENAPVVRERIVSAFSFLGLKLENNDNNPEDRILSSPDSKVKVLMIHTQESYEIANECFTLTSK